MIRIAHISDIHIRNFKYHAEYRETFENLYEQLRDLKPDLVVNTGDTAHSKLQISPELVQMIADHFEAVSDIAPYVVMLGNHDLNLHNLQRVDAISPIASQFEHVHLLKTCEPFDFSNGHTGVTLWPFAMADSGRYPTARTVQNYDADVDDPINIGLFHGSVAGCVTDSEWTMAEAEHDVRIFDGFDYVLMGDIHKQQFFRDRRVAYAGSLIQQNFGETHDKGFLFWKIEDKEEFSVRHVPVQSPLKFRTVRALDDLSIPRGQSTSKGAYVRVFVPRAISASEQRALVSEAKAQLEAKEVICVLSPEAQDQKSRPVMSFDGDEVTNVRSLDSQETMLRKFLDDRGVDEQTVQRVVDLNKRLQSVVADDDDLARNSRWNLSKIGWSNLFGYGEGNIIDFSALPGVTGIFGPNGTGKSSIFDVINEGLFDKVTKDVSKNIELVNDNKEEAKVVCHLTVDHRDYIVERTISRIKYGQRKKDVKEWGKTDVDFYVVEDGERVSLNGQSRPETERAIRRVLGSFEDFCLTSFSPQNSIVGLPGGGDIISCKETDRKKILYRVLDLDIFEKKAQAAREQAKSLGASLKNVGIADLTEEIEGYRRKIDVELPRQLSEWTVSLRESQEKLERLLLQKQSEQQEHDSIKASNTTFRQPSLIKAEIASTDREIEKRQMELDKMGEFSEWVGAVPQDRTHELKQAEFEIRGVEKAVENNFKAQEDGRWKLRVLDDVPCGEQFPTCKFLIDAFNAKKKIPDLSAEQRSLETTLSSMKNDLASLREIQARWNSYQSHRRQALQHGEERLKIFSRLSQLKEFQKTLDSELRMALVAEAALGDSQRKQKLRASIDRLTKEITGARNEVEEVQGSIAHVNVTIGSMRTILKDAEQQLAEALKKTEELNVYELYAEAFGKNGIPRVILARALPMLNAEINRILSNIVDFSVFLEHDESDQSMGLYLQYGQYQRRNIALSGGADRFIASLAIRAALLSVSSLPRTNMFIIDEGFGKLDPAMLDSVQRMFDYLKSCFDHVLLVSHLDGMRDAIDNVIEIGSDSQRYAHVEVC